MESYNFHVSNAYQEREAELRVAKANAEFLVAAATQALHSASAEINAAAIEKYSAKIEETEDAGKQ